METFLTHQFTFVESVKSKDLTLSFLIRLAKSIRYGLLYICLKKRGALAQQVFPEKRSWEPCMRTSFGSVWLVLP